MTASTVISRAAFTGGSYIDKEWLNLVTPAGAQSYFSTRLRWQCRKMEPTVAPTLAPSSVSTKGFVNHNL